jgi:ParB family transcriptional regulator, chromosome partitioning protein
VTTVLDIPLSQISAHPANPRKDIVADADFDALVASVRTNGVEVPCFVVADDRATDAKPRYWLVGGHRRHAASKVVMDGKRLGIAQTLPAIVRDDLDTPGKQLQFMVADNLHRVDLSPIETGDAIQALLDLGEGFTPASVAKATGLSPNTVRDRLKLAKMPEAARVRIHSGQVTLADAIAMATFTDQATLTRLTKAAGTNDFPYQLQLAKELKAQRTGIAKATRVHTKAGAAILPDYPDDDDGWCSVSDLVEYVESFRDVTADEAPDQDVDQAWAAQVATAETTHTACPGHAVVIKPQGYPRGAVCVDVICTDPDKQHPRLATQRTPDMDAAAKLAEAERAAAAKADAEQRANLDTATKVRRAHLRTVIEAGDPEHALAALRDLAKSQVRAGYAGVPVRFAAALLLEYPDAPRFSPDVHGGEKDLEENVGYAINRLTLPALAILLSVFDAYTEENSLIRASSWPAHPYYSPLADRSKTWRKRLVEVFGYPWSPIERELLGDVDQDQAASS